jgi:superfamily II DNA/RNA helicase
MVFPTRYHKLHFLIFFLQQYLTTSKSIIFFNTCASVEFYAKLLSQLMQERGFEFGALIWGIHGKLKNHRRARIANKFGEAKTGCLMATDVIARGIDFEQINYIIQVDPPENPDNYVHRIGRTARINQPGVAILLIEKHEETFINYLANKNVGIKFIASPSYFIPKFEQLEVVGVEERIKSIMLSDRDYIEKGKRAFVSFIRSYTEHDLKYIFEFKNLCIGSTAQSFFLLRIPRIK